MSDPIAFAFLTAAQIDQCWPLVQSLVDRTDQDGWRRYARQMIRGGRSDRRARSRGILMAQDKQGYICGLASFSILPDLHHGRVLLVDLFLVMNMFGADQVATRLIAALVDLAGDNRCQAVLASLPDAHIQDVHSYRQRLSGWFAQSGLVLEGRQFCRPLESVPDPVVIRLDPAAMRVRRADSR